MGTRVGARCATCHDSWARATSSSPPSSSSRTPTRSSLGRRVSENATRLIGKEGTRRLHSSKLLRGRGGQTYQAGSRGVQEIIDNRKERFVLLPDEVETMMEAGDFRTKTELLAELTRHTGDLSLPPISNFRVSSAALGASGRVYIGVNIEFESLPLPCSLHAEQFLIMNALQHRETSILNLCISHVPCGHCRQFMCELHKSEEMKIQILGMEDQTFTLPQLLPMRFTPKDLIGEDATFLFQKTRNGLAWTPDAARAVAESGSSDPDLETLATLALAEANASYAPYSKCPSGLAILDAEGNCFSGGLIESAAYNPSVSPLHSALVNALISGMGGGWDQIRRVILVEPANAPVKHEHVLRETLKFICPRADYAALYCEPIESS